MAKLRADTAKMRKLAEAQRDAYAKANPVTKGGPAMPNAPSVPLVDAKVKAQVSAERARFEAHQARVAAIIDKDITVKDDGGGGSFFVVGIGGDPKNFIERQARQLGGGYVVNTVKGEHIGKFGTFEEAEKAARARVLFTAKRDAETIMAEKYEPEKLAKAYRVLIDPNATQGEKEAAGTTARAQTRALLFENGVSPRDGLRKGSGDIDVDPANLGQATAVHGWDGKVGARKTAMEDAASELEKKPGTFKATHWSNGASGLEVMVHEEMHGASPFRTPEFYQGHGAVVEEVTVEMAARKITKKATGNENITIYDGAYQKPISKMRVAMGATLGVSPEKAADMIADAGMKMRAPGAKTFTTADEITDCFLDNLPPMSAEKRGTLRDLILQMRL